MMYRVILRVERVPPDIGPQAAIDIMEGFKERPWHEKAICSYEDGGLSFISENDFDTDGLATQDEFAHEFANVPIFEEDDGNLRIVRAEIF
jgi:hypothetical protein